MKKGIANSSAFAGWFVAALLVGVVLGSGFQTGTEKFGVVDVRKVIIDSKLGNESQEKVKVAGEARYAILKFIDEQRTISASQIARFRELELRETKTDTEKLELDALKKKVMDDAKEFERLSTLPGTPTEVERLKLIELTKLAQESRNLLAQLEVDLDRDYQNVVNELQNQAIDKANAAATVVAKSKGITVLFSSSAVVYAANDITADAVTQANK
jgi:Skp family chaperone for outer membrane proteins